jgi:hypothetical protein
MVRDFLLTKGAGCFAIQKVGSAWCQGVLEQRWMDALTERKPEATFPLLGHVPLMMTIYYKQETSNKKQTIRFHHPLK